MKKVQVARSRTKKQLSYKNNFHRDLNPTHFSAVSFAYLSKVKMSDLNKLEGGSLQQVRQKFQPRPIDIEAEIQRMRQQQQQAQLQQEQNQAQQQQQQQQQPEINLNQEQQAPIQQPPIQQPPLYQRAANQIPNRDPTFQFQRPVLNVTPLTQLLAQDRALQQQQLNENQANIARRQPQQLPRRRTPQKKQVEFVYILKDGQDDDDDDEEEEVHHNDRPLEEECESDEVLNMPTLKRRYIQKGQYLEILKTEANEKPAQRRQYQNKMFQKEMQKKNGKHEINYIDKYVEDDEDEDD